MKNMNRFKFRVWDTFDKKMICPEQLERGSKSEYPQTLAMGLHGLPVCFDRDSFKPKEIIGWNRDHNLIPMQCTGLKDKSGVLIYEGDIFENEISGGYCQIYDIPEQGGFITAPIDKFDHVPLFGSKLYAVLRDNPDHLIIGNIHENPELRKELNND